MPDPATITATVAAGIKLLDSLIERHEAETKLKAELSDLRTKFALVSSQLAELQAKFSNLPTMPEMAAEGVKILQRLAQNNERLPEKVFCEEFEWDTVKAKLHLGKLADAGLILPTTDFITEGDWPVGWELTQDGIGFIMKLRF